MDRVRLRGRVASVPTDDGCAFSQDQIDRAARETPASLEPLDEDD